MTETPQPYDNGRIDGARSLRRYLQVVVFCSVIALLTKSIWPANSYLNQLAYSLSVGTFTWAIIELGARLIKKPGDVGWPSGWQAQLLTVVGISAGFYFGSMLGDLFTGNQAGMSRSDATISWSITAIAGVAVSYYFFARGSREQLVAQAATAQRVAAEARLKLLQTQLEPHMLFNTLANLRVLIGTDPDRAQHMLDHLIDYLRATLGASRASEHALQTEFERIKDYLELMAVRMGPRLSYTLELPPELANHPVPTLLLQPLVENSIRHGLEPKVEGGSVKVSARREGDWLLLEVSDTGVGMQTALDAVQAPAGGFGVAQVRERLAVAYGSRFAIESVVPPAGGTSTIIRLSYEVPHPP